MRSLLFCCVFFGVTLVSTQASADQKIITLFTWPDYMDPDVLLVFEKETGIHVHEVNYQSDDLKDDLLLETKGEGFDVICSAGWSMRNYAKNQWLRELDPARMTNREHIADWVKPLSRDLEKYTMPYMWGTMGIAYRSDKVQKPVTRWRDLLVPGPALHGKILMFNDSSEMLGMALKTVGASAISNDPTMLAAAEKILLEQKPHVLRYGYEDLSEKASLVRGDVWMAPVFNGDALVLKGYNPYIEFVLPEEGSWVFMDFMAVTKKSSHADEAMRFINFLHRPDIAAKLSTYLKFATTNASALKLLPPEILNNPVIYPPASFREKSDFLGGLDNAQVAKRNAITAKVLD